MVNLPSTDDFDKGREAYLNGDGHLYLSGSQDFKDGYREAFDEDNVQAHDNSGFRAEAAWDQHYFHEIDGTHSTTLDPEPGYVIATGGSE